MNPPKGIESSARSILSAPRAALPVVTVTWAQSATGAIAAAGGARTALSGPESLALTHRLRAMHDAILVGILTVIADDPLLSVRLANGPQPQPVILDTHLRFPLAARLLSRTDRKPWIFHAGGSADAARDLEQLGARLFRVRSAPGGVDLPQVLAALCDQGIRSLMVEGGALVLRAFISQGLADQAVVTVSPSPTPGVDGPGIPPLSECLRERYGVDTVTWGRVALR